MNFTDPNDSEFYHGEVMTNISTSNKRSGRTYYGRNAVITIDGVEFKDCPEYDFHLTLYRPSKRSNLIPRRVFLKNLKKKRK